MCTSPPDATRDGMMEGLAASLSDGSTIKFFMVYSCEWPLIGHGETPAAGRIYRRLVPKLAKMRFIVRGTMGVVTAHAERWTSGIDWLQT
jgi:hypothetical protein